MVIVQIVSTNERVIALDDKGQTWYLCESLGVINVMSWVQIS